MLGEVLGIEDTSIWLAYVLCIACTILCVVYGAVNWNRGDEAVREQDVKWAADEKKIEEDL